MLAPDINSRLNQIYNPQDSILRQAQLRMLDMLIYIDELCQKLHIDYQLNSGNVLGAVRHGGFIPWDDDIDIILQRTDYNCLCNFLERNPHPLYKLQSHKTDPHYYRFWNTLRDTKSKYLNDNKIDREFLYTGLVIDIFPYEPGRILILKRIATKIASINARYFIGKHKILAELLYQLQAKCINPLFNLFSRLFGNKNMYSHTYGVGFYKEVSADILFPSSKIVFEDHIFKGPNNPIKYCRTIYGNYNELPTEEQRNHHQCNYLIW